MAEGKQRDSVIDVILGDEGRHLVRVAFASDEPTIEKIEVVQDGNGFAKCDRHGAKRCVCISAVRKALRRV